MFFYEMGNKLHFEFLLGCIEVIINNFELINELIIS